MSYALIRGGAWVTAPEDQGEGLLLPPVLGLGPKAQAWLAPDLDAAIERSSLLRCCWGWNTEIRAV